MLDDGEQARGAARTLDPPPDIATDRPTGRPRTWATLEETYELVRQAHERDRPGVRWYRCVGNHCADVYAELVKWKAIGGDGTVSMAQLARSLYDDDAALENAASKRHSIRNWLRRLVDAGLIAWEPRAINGKWVGIEYRLLAVPELHSQAARGYSSVGKAPAPCEARRRRETRAERRARRIAPWRRRSGQKGVGRVDVGRPLQPPERFFRSGDFHHLEPSLSLRDREGKQQDRRERARGALPAWVAALKPWLGDGVDARRPPMEGQTGSLAAAAPAASAAERGPPRSAMPSVADAIQMACPPVRRDALRQLRTASLKSGGLEAVAAAAAAGAPIDVVALAAWSVVLPGLEPRLSIKMRERLERSAAQYDRLAGRGAAAAFILRRLTELDLDARQGLAPRTLAFYIADLRASSRALRRHCRGRPPPRPHRSRGRA